MCSDDEATSSPGSVANSDDVVSADTAANAADRKTSSLMSLWDQALGATPWEHEAPCAPSQLGDTPRGLSALPQPFVVVQTHLAHGAFDEAAQQAKELQLPICFDHAEVNDSSDEVVDALMHSLASRFDLRRFYVGVTMDPIRRWLGGASDRSEQGVMRGHCAKYENMVILAFRGPGLAAPLESLLIASAKAIHGERCLNRAIDSRGCVNGVANFVYCLNIDGWVFIVVD